MNTTINLGTDNVKKIFWTYAIPSILAMIAQTTATLIDSIFIGQFVGAEGLSAITLFFPLLGILIGIGSMFAIGGTTLAGIELGKGNKEKSNNYFNVTLLFLSVLSIASTFIVVMNMETLTSILKIDDQSRLYVIQYGQTISYFFLFFMLNFALSFFLKLDGKPILVVIVMVSGTLINIILDYLLIVHFKMGLTGAALATGASQLIPWSILIINTLFRSNWRIEIPKIRWHEIKAIVFNGSSELLSNSAISIASIVINMMIINRVGVIGLAGYAVAIQVASIATSLGYGFGESNQTGISFNIGANQLDRVEAFRKYTLKANITTGSILFVITFFFGHILAKLFVNDISTIQMASNILKYYAFAFIFMGANITIGTYYTAINDPISSGGITFYRSLIGLGIGLIVFPIFFGDEGIWLAIIFREVSTFIIGMFMIKNKPYGLNIKKMHSTKKAA